jgi:hypothetical protein
LYWSASFIVVTRPRAAVMESGDGVCAGEAQTENRSRPAMIDKRLDMAILRQQTTMILENCASPTISRPAAGAQRNVLVTLGSFFTAETGQIKRNIPYRCGLIGMGTIWHLLGCLGRTE